MDILIDLFESEAQAMEQFAAFLRERKLVLCRQVTISYPEMPEVVQFVGLKAVLTEWTRNRHVRYDYKDTTLRTSIQGNIAHYQKQAIKIWDSVPEKMARNIDLLALEVDGQTFVYKFWPVWNFEGEIYTHGREDYENFDRSTAEMVGWDIEEKIALKL